MRPKGSSETLEKRRFRAIRLLYQGNTPRRVAELLGVDIRSVKQWKQTFRQKGKMYLLAKPHPRRKGSP